jgi:hypothetical protein
MGQGGQTQKQSTLQRIEEAAERLAGEKKAPAPVPDVAGRDIPTPLGAVTLAAAPPAPPAPAQAPVVVGDGVAGQAAGTISDVGLLRDQLEQVVVNLRSRLDTHEKVLGDLNTMWQGAKTAVDKIAKQVESHEALINALVDALEAIK